MRSLAVALLCCAVTATAAAQTDVIARARAAADAGRRADGIALLQQHLSANPNDVDARLVYGLILSWDGKYDEARAALTAVLAQAPEYLDARVALMNVEWWSGRLDAARAQARAVLSVDPGNTQARLVRQRLDARTRPWSAGVTVTRDTFSGDREPWLETAITLGRQTPAGALIVRGSQADRFGLSDRQVDVEFFPVFRAGTYGLVAIGFGQDDLLYPDQRMSFELYQSLGRGVEVSGGFRRLEFSETSTMYLGTLTKYAGNWMVTGKVSLVPDETRGDAWSYHASVRRYFGAEGTSFAGAGYSRGFSREEPRGAGDLIRVDADTVRAQADVDVSSRVRLSVSASGSREVRTQRDPLWQTTLGAGLTFRF